MEIGAAIRQQTGKSARRLAREGMIPAVVYGHKVAPRTLSLNFKEFERVYHRAGHTQLVDLKVDGGSMSKVLIKAVQISPRHGLAIHVDLHQVSLREKLHTEVPILVVGEPEAVRRGDAELLQLVQQVHVECLPAAIPELIEVSTATLVEIDDAVRAADLVLPPGVTLLDDGDEVIVKLAGRRAAEVDEKAVSEPALDQAAETASEEG
ncbi:MAG TPA: 50S ribosomal protein L25 [Candidatus Nitrosotalea sp.]|nr:50S ribosomal protein L25 [Candidatus Nitrosotalea sp.]